eukprot:s443_g48.t1
MTSPERDLCAVGIRKVLRLEPGNEAARRELEKLEEVLPPVAPDVLAKRQEDLPSTATVPKDPAAAVRMAQKEAEKFRREILAVADQKGCVSEWCKKFNKVQVMAADWAKHQLKDPEILQDLLTLRGPLFEAMDAQQREDFLCAYDFVQEVRQRHQDEIDAGQHQMERISSSKAERCQESGNFLVAQHCT